MHKNSFFKLVLVLASEILVGIMVIILCLSFLVVVFERIIGKFDKTIIDAVYAFRSEQMTEFMLLVTFLGGEIFIGSGILILCFLLYQKHKKSAFDFAFVLLYGIVINLFLKVIYQRPRPEYLPLIHEVTHSFPSGHAMNSFIFYTCVGYFICRNTKNKRLRTFVIAGLSVLVLLIGLSRVYLGAHYPSDVIAGYIAGALWFVLVVVVEKTVNKYHMFKRSS